MIEFVLDDTGGEGVEGLGVGSDFESLGVDGLVGEFDPGVAINRGVDVGDGEAAFENGLIGVGAESKVGRVGGDFGIDVGFDEALVLA